jgi:L-fuconolactonase
MDIVDCQVHIGPGGIEETVASMDALGIKSILIDEFWGEKGDPAYPVGEGGARQTFATAELASWTYPERFSYLIRLSRHDPEARSIIRIARDAPYARAVRVGPAFISEAEVASFGRGEYDELFAEACDCGLPMFVFNPGNAPMVRRYAVKYPELKIVIDHCGMPFGRAPNESPSELSARLTAFDAVLSMSDLPNVALKWTHSFALFGVTGFPAEGIRPFLRRAINSFGADRVMWGTDVTRNQTADTWAELLYSMIANPDLSSEEREYFLGKTVRKWLNWPATAAAPGYVSKWRR